MENLELYEKVRKVPEEAKKTIGGGKLKGFTDINPMWRIKTLIEHFGMCGFGWYYECTRQWIEEGKDEKVACVNINLYIKVDGEWSKPIFGTGGSKLVTSEKSGLVTSDECYKMATTDAISVACKSLGIGADVYWDKDRTKYDNKPDEDNPKQEKDETPSMPEKPKAAPKATTNSNKKEPETPPKVEDMKIDAIKVMVLTDKCIADGVHVGYILKSFKLNKLEDMTEKQFSQTINNWSVVCEKAKLWNSQAS